MTTAQLRSFKQHSQDSFLYRIFNNYTMVAVIPAILSFLSVLWGLFVSWMMLFLAPFNNFNVLWITIPVWISWFVADYFQEKQVTSFGNAVSNGVIPAWVALDWTRFLVDEITAGKLFLSWQLTTKFFICLLVLVYGITIIYFGIKAKPVVRWLGRIREVTYLLLVFTPIVYGIHVLTWQLGLAIVIYFPVFYFGVELLFKILPPPKAMRRDEI